ncbi:hypothetical protein L5515_003733 [Caenorhabditis briggsae]|uniref:Uncharacterized protein n=1 Tax=Caenorhabditis briggsae TaxID=6238 RepID=A0AAE9JBD0_CAEBR|nr:hypothetical protein L5515_003733 [Caenorhabditis briggsae]
MEFTERREETKNDYFQLNVSGKIMNFRLSNQYQDPEAYCHPSDKESAMEPIHNYFLDFFGDTVEYQYVGHYKEFIPHLPKVSLCLSFWADNVEGTIDIKDIEEYLASSPVLKHISMELVKPELFCPESEFWQVESITLIINNNTVPAFLRHFRGRQAFLRCYDRNTLDLIEFMNRSRTGEQCQKLEYLKIAIEFNNLPNELLNENGVKHIDAIKKSPMHTLPKR